MKIINSLGFVIVGAAVLFVGGFFLKDIVEKNEAQIEKDLNDWVDRLIAESLSKKVDASPSTILRTLTKGENAPLTQKIQQLIKSVDLVFQRRSSLSKVEVILNASFQDGTSLSVNIERAWDDLPATIRKKFLKTNNKSITVPWNLPLVNVQST